MASERVRVAVLGGGLTGLSASNTLRQAGVHHRLFEREAVVGGHAVTLEERASARSHRALLHLRDPKCSTVVRACCRPIISEVRE